MYSQADEDHGARTVRGHAQPGQPEPGPEQDRELQEHARGGNSALTQSREEAGELSSKQKFLIQSTPVRDEVRGDVKNLISRYNAENSSKIENIRLVMRIEGLGDLFRAASRASMSPQVANFETVLPAFEAPVDVKPTPELNRRLEELERQEVGVRLRSKG